MAAKKTGTVIALAAVVVVGVALIAYFSSNRPPTPTEQVTGAIGAAERYHAEQISDEDVILDIPGEVEVTEAVIAVLDDEQAADLLDSLDDTALEAVLKRANASREQYAAMTAQQKAVALRQLNRQDLKQLAQLSRVNERAFNNMSERQQARLWSRLGVNDRTTAMARVSDSMTAWKHMTDRQLSSAWHLLAAEDRAELAAHLNVIERALSAMTEVERAGHMRGADQAVLARVFERSGSNLRNPQAFVTLSQTQLAAAWQVMPQAERGPCLANADFTAMAMARVNERQLDAAWNRLPADARTLVLDRVSARGETLDRVNQRGGAQLMRQFLDSRAFASHALESHVLESRGAMNDRAVSE